MRTCPICGAEFEPIQPEQKYESRGCKNEAKIRRRGTEAIHCRFRSKRIFQSEEEAWDVVVKDFIADMEIAPYLCPVANYGHWHLGHNQQKVGGLTMVERAARLEAIGRARIPQ